MHWDRLFEDLEGQLAAEWESERAALDAESERLRISRIELRGRLRILCEVGAEALIDLPGGLRLRVGVRTLGADWFAAEAHDAETRTPRTIRLVPLHALRGLSVDHGLLLASLDEGAGGVPSLRERMTFGFVLRDLARRRVPVHLTVAEGDEIHGTIDRAGADHLDLALHDAGQARVAGSVQGYRMIPFHAVTSLRTAGDHLL